MAVGSDDNRNSEYGNHRIYNAVVALCIVLGAITLLLLAHAAFSYFTSLNSDGDFGKYGQQGDFFGGHLGPIFGSLTLITVIYTGYVQQRQQNDFFAKQQKKAEEALFYQSFTQGIDLISQWDRQDPGCPQSLRLVDYYAKIAINRNDPELYRLLNTVITGEMRNLFKGRSGVQYITNYPYAIVALERIKEIRKETMDFKKANQAVLDAAKKRAKQAPAAKNSSIED